MNHDCAFVHSHVIAADPHEVFACFADAAILAQWWGPDGFSSTFHEFEFRNGGTWRLTLQGPDGAQYPNESLFREIVPGQRVVIEHLGGVHHFMLTVEFEAVGREATRVHWRQVFDTPEERERVAPYVVPANEQNLRRLEAAVLRAKASF